ncbi:hypothetical protein BB560_005103 [Smittium megazygosporum]|uniref:Uncharacterized protein n=1 Tax=Smittium megazygosporum TaxID=133381 RepID=A0A2T9Z7E2_9FUNG|nr:hypothetical protein BB560_005103 [Smittium megazygosporum]
MNEKLSKKVESLSQSLNIIMISEALPKTNQSKLSQWSLEPKYNQNTGNFSSNAKPKNIESIEIEKKYALDCNYLVSNNSVLNFECKDHDLRTPDDKIDKLKKVRNNVYNKNYEDDEEKIDKKPYNQSEVELKNAYTAAGFKTADLQVLLEKKISPQQLLELSQLLKKLQIYKQVGILEQNPTTSCKSAIQIY